jgi:glycosyltransferase involved in cell wall biosynthesis
MKILFTRFPLESTSNGGAELQTMSLMRGLRERGHEVAFAGSCQALLKHCREEKIPAMEWDIGPPPVTKWHAISFAWRKKHMTQSLQRLMDDFFQDEHRVDAMIMLSLSGKLLLTDIALDAGAKVLWIEHDRVGNWLRKNPWLTLLLRQSRKVTTVVVSELSRRLYTKLGWHNQDIVVIPNGVDRRRLEGRGKENALEQTAHPVLRIGCIARLSSEKGVDLLIEAIAPLAGLHLEIVGSGKEMEKLQAMVKASNIMDMVTFTTRVDNVADVYARIDALVLPSRDHDPFGLVAAEAMMCGVPVIVTDQCGIASYLHDEKDGIVVKAESVAALQKAIASLQDPLHRTQMAHHGKETAEKLFALQTMIDRYEEVLKN